MTTLGSLFDGIGGSLLCATMCGATPVWASEIEPFPINVTQYHYPDVIHLGDITKINGAEIPPVDMIVGGSPCQDLSVAGKRAGMAGARSGLFMEQIRIIKEMREKFGADKPRFMVWENVPGAFSSNDGEDFRAVLEETARIADPTVSIPRSVTGWANSGSVLGVGFSISWRTIDAQYWGVPQRRRRIYLVADFRGQSAPEILFERKGEPWYFATGKGDWQGTAKPVKESTRTTIAFTTEITPKINENGIAFSLRQRDYKDPQSVCYDMTHANEAIRECGDKSPTLQNRMGTGGNQVPVVMAHGQANAEIAMDQCPTLNCNHEQPIIATQTVRRLTPLECERLQGYPDNYTNIPGASDSARYKALGNSFAIPCALFVIGGCIAQIETEGQHDTD